MNAEPISFFGATRQTLHAHVTALGMRRHVGDQVLDWVYDKGIVDPAAMTNVSARDRETLGRTVRFLQGAVVRDQHATDGTRKLLLDFAAPDETAGLPVLTSGADRRTECVMIPTESRRTACVSSQIGCPVGCTFCASGIGGLGGNLRAEHIVEQVFRLGRLEGVGRISNVVFMGMGEPLANFAAVTDAIRILHATWGLGVGARRITVSTVGLPKAIRRLATFELPVTLALSLHAPNDELRRRLIPWAEYASIEELLDACCEYFRETGREITLEYLLLGRVNDRPEHAAELADVAHRIRANVNLIRYNEVSELPYERPANEDVLAFQAALRGRKVNVHIRASRGRDIDAACGQLARSSRGS